jgi:hypothetical protein
MGYQVTPNHRHSVADGELFKMDANLVAVTCNACGMLYAIPEALHDSALKYRGDKTNGWRLCCPVGHTWWYVGGESDEAKIRRLEREKMATRELLEFEQRSHAATRGHVTRKRKQLERVAKGVCPECNRTFVNLQRHMETKHDHHA